MIKPNHFTFKIAQKTQNKGTQSHGTQKSSDPIDETLNTKVNTTTKATQNPKPKQGDLKNNATEEMSNVTTTEKTEVLTTPPITEHVVIQQDQIFSVEVTYLTQENMYYIIDDELLRSLDEPFKVSLELWGKTETSVMLHQKIINNYGKECDGKSNNANKIGERLQCLAKHLGSNHCPNKCLPMKYRALYQKHPFDTFTFPCKNSKEERCMLEAMDATLTSEECEKTCKVKSYGGTHRSIKKDPSKINGTVGVLRTIVNERTEDVKEENRVYDMFGFVGTVGGTLSLFLGFSFYSIIEFWVHYLRELPEAF